MTATWEAALAELAGRERDAIAAERWDELAALQDERARGFAALPRPLPRELRPVLESALAQSRETERRLRAAMAETELMLSSTRSRRRVAAAYAASSGPRVERRA